MILDEGLLEALAPHPRRELDTGLRGGALLFEVRWPLACQVWRATGRITEWFWHFMRVSCRHIFCAGALSSSQ